MGSVPGNLSNTVRGSILLVAGVLTDTDEAIALGKHLASGSGDASQASKGKLLSPEDLTEVQEELDRWLQALCRVTAESPSSDAALLWAELEKRDAELKELEDKHRQLEDELRNYPRPIHLVECDNEDGVNIAVVGNSGVGKSLLINSLRGVQNGDPTWAPVGVNRTTTEPVAYALPGKTNARLWDLAGVGSQQFPPGGYTRAIGLRYFDFVLVVTTCRFTQTEAVLLSELYESDVPTFVVRTMVDVDIASNEADHGRNGAETKQGIIEDLRERGVPNPYLINSRNPTEHDFPRLAKDLQFAAERRGQPPAEAKTDTIRAKSQDPHKELPEMSQAVAKFEVGETAEVWSKHIQLWVKCVIEKLGVNSDEYDIYVPAAPPDACRIPRVPALALRKAQVFLAGDAAEIVVLQGPRAGSWVGCRIVSNGEKPDMYNVHVPEAPLAKRDLMNVHSSALRTVHPEATDQPTEVQPPFMSSDNLKEMLKAFKEVCILREFQATVESLQEKGTHMEEVRSMKRTFIFHQFNPVLARYNIPTTPLGWGNLLAFTRTQGKDAEVIKLAHEVEKMLKIRVGDFFGIQADNGEQVDVRRTWQQHLKEMVLKVALQAAHRSHQAAQAQASSGAPMSRNQRVAANYADPMSRSVVSATSSFRASRLS